MSEHDDGEETEEVEDPTLFGVKIATIIQLLLYLLIATCLMYAILNFAVLPTFNIAHQMTFIESVFWGLLLIIWKFNSATKMLIHTNYYQTEIIKALYTIIYKDKK